MTKSRRFSKNLARFALFNLLSVTLLFGCQANIEPTYKEKNIPSLVKKICKEEYNLDVTTFRTDTTLWIYAPTEKILHKDYGVIKDKIFDEEMWDKLRNILTTIGRVLISSDNTPEFYALTISDIKQGVDFAMIGNVLDIKKSYAGFIPPTESNRRYVHLFKLVPEAVGDTKGGHIEPYNITLPDFLAEQIAQRIGAIFQEEGMKNYFKVEKSVGGFSKNVFFFAYSMQKTSPPPKPVDIKEMMLDTIAYCLQTYEFKDFDGVVITDLTTRDRTDVSRGLILSRKIL